MGRARVVVVAALVVTAVLPDVAAAQGQPLAVLTAITKALSDAAEAVGKFAESLEKATRAGLRTYDLVAARRAADRLKEIGGRAAALPMEQRVLVLDPLQAYLRDARQALDLGAPLPDAEPRWAKATAHIDEILPKVQSLLSDVRAAQSDFVDPAPYNALVAALGGRSLILGQLRGLSPPRSREEVAQLQGLHERYVELIAQLGRANAALEQYIVKATSP
jgi:hypothetical protein